MGLLHKLFKLFEFILEIPYTEREKLVHLRHIEQEQITDKFLLSKILNQLEELNRRGRKHDR